MVPFSFAGRDWAVVDGAALFLPSSGALIVSDLHLEKASWFAMRGQPLPPYDSRATLERIAAAVRLTGARRVYTLGDNFHDDAGEARLEPHAAGMLSALTGALDWTWVVGNHDPDIAGRWGGRVAREARLEGVALRHQIDLQDTGPELSGHFHPKWRIALRGRSVSRPCFVIAGTRMVMPAFGSLTGGLDAGDPAVAAALGEPFEIQACLPAGGKMLRFGLRGSAAARV